MNGVPKNALRWLRSSAVPVTFWGLMALSLIALQPGQRNLDQENGMGGPAEPLLGADQLQDPALSRLDQLADAYGSEDDLLAGVWLAPDYQPLCAPQEVGPLGSARTGRLEIRIRPRQTFYETLVERGVPHEDVMTLVAACRSFRNLSTVKAGEVFRIDQAADGGLRSLGFDLDEESYVTWVRQGDTYVRQDGMKKVDTGGVQFETIITWSEDIAAAVHELAAAHKMDMITVGSRGLSPAAAAILGGNAERILLHAPQPVLIVKRKGETVGLLNALLGT